MKKRECNIGGHKHSKAEDRKEERSKQQQGGWPQASVKKGAARLSEKSEKTIGFHMFLEDHETQETEMKRCECKAERAERKEEARRRSKKMAARAEQAAKKMKCMRKSPGASAPARIYIYIYIYICFY